MKIGLPNDKYWQEADRVIDEVMPEPRIQRQVEQSNKNVDNYMESEKINNNPSSPV